MLEEWQPPPGYTDPLDSTGRRCEARADGVGVCERRHDHAQLGDPWHHAVTDYDAATRTCRHWRWLGQ